MVKGGRGKKHRSRRSRNVFRINAKRKKNRLAREKAQRAEKKERLAREKAQRAVCKKQQQEQVGYSNWFVAS